MDDEALGPSKSWSRPSPRLLVMRRVEAALLAVVVAAAVAWAGSLSSGALGGSLGAAALVLGLPAQWWVQRRVRAWAYQEREDDLLVRRGVMFRRLSVVPYGRMQFVDVTAGPVERIYGLATVKMHTAAMASDARIPGLERQDAARLRDQLARLGESRLAGL
jgi:membrane protein YdbS with pleckstrin-like domain